MCLGEEKCEAPKGVRECTECVKCGDVICRKRKLYHGERCWQCRYLHMHWNGMNFDDDYDSDEDNFF